MRVIDEEGNNVGVLAIEEALKLAREKNLDLIEISETANPPIAKIYDFGKFLYQKDKEERKQKVKQKADEMKIIRLTFGIGQHDLEYKAKQVEEFLKEKARVQIEMTLKGREKARQDFARQKMVDFLKLIDQPAKVIQNLKSTPRGLIIVISN